MKILVPCLAVLVIGALEAIALFKGIDGLILTTVIAVIAAIAGAKIAPTIEAIKGIVKKGKKL
jgi:hypothetical protein